MFPVGIQIRQRGGPQWRQSRDDAIVYPVTLLDEANRSSQATLEATRKTGMPQWEDVALKVRGQLHFVRSDEEAVRKGL